MDSKIQDGEDVHGGHPEEPCLYEIDDFIEVGMFARGMAYFGPF